MRTISDDLKTVLSSFRFWFCVLMIILSCIVVYIGNAAKYFIGWKMNPVNMFLTTTFYNNVFLDMFVPFIPVLACTALWTKKNKDIIDVKNKSFILRRSISTMISSGMVLLIGYGVYMMICLIYNPEIPGNPLALYYALGKDFFLYKPRLFALIFIINNTICGAAYGLLGMGIFLNTKNQSMSVLIPGIIYNSADYMCWAMPLPLRSILAWIRPFYTFRLLSVTLPEVITQLLFIFALSIGLIIIATMKNPEKNLAEESRL